MKTNVKNALSAHGWEQHLVSRWVTRPVAQGLGRSVLPREPDAGAAGEPLPAKLLPTKNEDGGACAFHNWTLSI